MQAKARFLLYSFALLLMANITCIAQPQMNAAQFFEHLRSAGNDSERVIAYNDIAKYYRDINPDTATIFAQKALDLAQKIKYKFGEGKSLGNLGIIFEIQTKFEQSTECLSKALIIFQQLDYAPGISASYNELGTVAGKKGNYDIATQYFLKAQKIEEDTHNMPGLMQTYLKLGVANEVSENLDEALKYYQKVLKLNEVIKDDDFGIMILNNIGIVYGKKAEYNKALSYFMNALAESDSLGESYGTRVLTLVNLGIIYGKMGDINKAMKYQTEALRIARERHIPEQEAKSLINLAELVQDKNPKQSIAYLDQAKAIAESSGMIDMQLDIILSMIAVDKQIGNYKEAFELLEKDRDISNEIFSRQKAKDIANLQSTYDLEKSTNKVQQLEIANKKNELQRNIILMVKLFLVIIFIIVFFFYTKTRRLNYTLFKQKEELKELNVIKDKLFSIIGHDLRAPMTSIVSMLSVWDSEEFSDEEKKKIIENLKPHSKASLDTLDKLLYWGQAQIKGIRLQQTQFNPEELIQKNLELVQESAKKKNITLVNKTNANANVYADPAHFDFVIRNLLSNAIKFTYEGGEVEVNAIPDMPGGYTTFTIKDNGTGIRKEQQKAIFEMNNSSTPGTANEKGTSIGLILCKEYITENGGTIGVESEEGKGSVFYFTLKNSRS